VGVIWFDVNPEVADGIFSHSAQVRAVQLIGVGVKNSGDYLMLLTLPERVDGRLARIFARELNRELMNDRPRIVVDLSQVKQIDSDALDTLLDCMVEVAKRDGAVKLGGASPEAATILELTRMDRVFEMFPTVAEAASSFSVARLEPATEQAPEPAAA
jgi:anti-sigma B factor antagonist